MLGVLCLFLVLLLVLMAIWMESIAKFGVSAIVLLGLLLSTLAWSGEMDNKTYAAAYRQGIVITTTRMGEPVVMQPCRVELDHIGNKLVLPGTVRVVTPEMLNAICGKEG